MAETGKSNTTVTSQLNTRGILLLFSALCVTMTGCLLIYMYHMNDVLDMSIKITNNVKQIINYDIPSIRKALDMSNNKSSSSTLPSDLKPTTGGAKHHITSPKIVHKSHSTSSARPDDCKECFNHDFNYIIDNPDICKQQDVSVPIEVFVMIFTTHARRLQRDTIRRTWMSIAKNNTAPNIRYVFLLGGTADDSLSKSVIEENNLNHDIIKEDFVDAYQNLTYKTMMGYKWASTKCAHASFVMKTDDDMYLNIPALFYVINTHKDALQTSVGGACHLQAVPHRDSRSKWYASKQSYPNARYPGFCSGTGYVTSMNVVKKVYEISPHIPFFHLEDVYVALCIKKLKYSLKPVPGFNSGRVRPDPCVYKSNRKMVTSHELPPEMIERIWNGVCRKPI